MYNSTLALLALAMTAVATEMSSSYTLLEKHAVSHLDPKAEPVETHSIYKKPTKNDLEHPVYRSEERNEGRIRIEPVRPRGPVIKHDAMLADQPTPSTEVNKNDLENSGYAYVPSPSEVAYPDIPYAPGYGYGNEYGASSKLGYDMYDNDPNNYLMEPDTSTMGLIWSQVPDPRTIVSYVGKTISWIFGSMFIIFLGSFLTVGVCSYTDLCTITFHGVGPIHEEMRSLISPERLEKISHAADFVKTAIDKYQKIQKVTDVNPARRRRAIF